MRILISPSKTMVKEKQVIYPKTTPIFNDMAYNLFNTFKSLSDQELIKAFKISKALLTNIKEYISLYDINGYTQAILSYTGIQYKNLDINTITNKDYLFNNVYIISAFYGLLKPSDMISLYRFDFLNNTYDGNLYDYWQAKVYQEIFKNKELVINLCSKEYENVFKKYLTNQDNYYNVLFLTNGKEVNIKKARGKFLRYLCENNIETIDDLIKYHDEYVFDHIDKNNIIFIKPNKNMIANPVSGMSEEEAYKIAGELGEGKNYGTWQGMSGAEFLKWWRESNKQEE